MAVPSRPSFSVAPPSVVATDDVVTLAALCVGSTSLAAYVLDGEAQVWSGTFQPVASGPYGALYSAEVPLAQAGLTAGNYKFAVQGVNGDGHGPSAYAAFSAYVRPQLSIAYPADGDPVTLLPLWVIWSVRDDGGVGIASQTVTVRHGSEVIATASPDPAVTQVSWHASELPLVNGEAYEAEVSLVDGMGATIAATAEFTTEWEAPAAPMLTAAPDDAVAAVTLAVASVRTDVTTNVWRVIDGERHLLGTVAGTSGTVTDPLPPLGVEVTYEAQSVYDETGAASAIASTMATVGGCHWALNYPEEAVVLLGRNPSSEATYEHGGDAYHFADGGAGGGLPVWYGLSDRDASGTLTFEPRTNEEALAVVALSKRHPVAWLRDPYGGRWRAHVTVTHSYDRRTRRLRLSWDAVRWEEMG